MTTSNITVYCSGIESMGEPSYGARKLGGKAVELVDVNIEALIDQAIIGVGYATVLDAIPLVEVISYIKAEGYKVEKAK